MAFDLCVEEGWLCLRLRPFGLIVSLPERHLSPITEYKAVEYIMQIIRLETNTSSAVPQRKRQPSLMSRVKLEYSYLFSFRRNDWVIPSSSPSLYPAPLFSEAPLSVVHVCPSMLPLLLLLLCLCSLSSWSAAINSSVNRQPVMLTKLFTDYTPGSESQLCQRGDICLSENQ